MARFFFLSLPPLLAVTLLAACGDGAATDCDSDDDCPVGACVGGVCRLPDGAVVGGGDAGGGALDGSTPPSDGGGGDDGGTGEVDGGAGADGGQGGGGTAPDEDGDGISDFDEGRAEGVDTDGDGTPDYLDDDSDGDGLSDAFEAGDDNPSTPPIDSDGDLIADFRDLDSDDNGIPDAIEGGGDTDGDGRPNHRDFDNDEDGLVDVVEIGGDPENPRNTDGDEAPDYDDPDSDGDFIDDTTEGLTDTDGDGTPDIFDDDSDGDGISDAEEAGDEDVFTPPADTDGDGTPDFRDPDSDADGLSDAAELAAGTDPRDADSDGDGVTDLVEVGAGTNPNDPGDNPRTRGDFVFVVPFMEAPTPDRDTLQFATDLQRADVYFLVDTTGSMGDEIAELRTSLSGTIIPDVDARIPEAWFGVGSFDDYPISPWGSSADRPLELRQEMTSSAADAQTAVNGLPASGGRDFPESHLPALWGLATRGTMNSGPTYPTCGAGERGAACFRADAVPVIVVLTDALAHNWPLPDGVTVSGFTMPYSGVTPTPPTYAETIAALNDLGARVVSVNSAPTGSTRDIVRTMLEEFAEDTSTVDRAGDASGFVFDIGEDGTGLTTAVVDAIIEAARIPLDVSARASDLDGGVDAVAAFVDRIEPRTTAAPGLTCTLTYPTTDLDGIDDDAFDDTFLAVDPGDPVCFDIVPRMNATVAPTLDPQLFRAQVDVLGDGFTPLDDRVVFFLVPPRIPDPNE
jgi:hypothetical protein